MINVILTDNDAKVLRALMFMIDSDTVESVIKDFGINPDIINVDEVDNVVDLIAKQLDEQGVKF